MAMLQLVLSIIYLFSSVRGLDNCPYDVQKKFSGIADEAIIKGFIYHFTMDLEAQTVIYKDRETGNRLVPRPNTYLVDYVTRKMHTMDFDGKCKTKDLPANEMTLPPSLAPKGAIFKKHTSDEKHYRNGKKYYQKTFTWKRYKSTFTASFFLDEKSCPEFELFELDGRSLAQMFKYQNDAVELKFDVSKCK